MHIIVYNMNIILNKHYFLKECKQNKVICYHNAFCTLSIEPVNILCYLKKNGCDFKLNKKHIY